MGEKTNIPWTQQTWNPWRGCHKVSPGCKNCYAEALYERNKSLGPFTVIQQSKSTFWDPMRWSRRAKGRELVFTCSISDFFHADADDLRPLAWKIIRDTPNLTYQILTKRPERISHQLPLDWGSGYKHVWLGISAENQQYYNQRWPILATVNAVVRFVSYEPALGALDLSETPADVEGRLAIDYPDWVICGGESGANRREMPLEWARSVRDQCKAAGIAFFFKQISAFRPDQGVDALGEVIREYPSSDEITTSRRRNILWTRFSG